MKISKTLSALSLAGALVAAAVALSPSDAAARAKSTTRNHVVIGGPGGVFKPKPAKPPMRDCKPSDHCRG